MSYDIAIIGAGPGGYIAAIRASQLGAKVLLIERDKLGGVCLNRGCIPTKTMIASVHSLHSVQSAGDFGVWLQNPNATVDMSKINARKNSVVDNLRDGISKLLKANGVDVVSGTASFTAPGIIAVDGKKVDAKNVIIATGSSWIELPNVKTDGHFIVTSDEALDWTSVPKSLAIVGGGVVGCEFACMMNAFGAKVTIIEAIPSILPPVEKAITRLLASSMKKQGITILAGTTVDKAIASADEVKVSLSDGSEISVDKVLVAVGRRPNTNGLNLGAGGVTCNERGFVKVDKNFKTSSANVSAIGDVIGNPMLAHAASAEGVAAVQFILGKTHKYESKFCPSPIFTNPEIASVGLSSQELEKLGIQFKTGRFPYAANGKANCDGKTDGQVLIHADSDGKILGVHIIGSEATLLIAEAALALKNDLTAGELSQTIHSHPTLSEIVAEAAEDVDGKSLHKAPIARSTKYDIRGTA